MKGFEATFKFVLRVFDYREDFYGLGVFLGIFLFFASIDLRGQVTSTASITNNASFDDREEISEELETFYSQNFNSYQYWDSLQKDFKGNDAEYNAIREKLVVKMYQLFSDFGARCLEQQSITAEDKARFKTEVSSALVKYMNDLSLDEILNTPLPSETPPPPLECENLDFEKCDFSGWQLFEGNVISSTSVNPAPMAFSYINIAPSITSGSGYPVLNMNAGREGVQHSIISVQGTDPNVPIKMIKPGGGCSAMIGDGFGTQYKAASIKRSITITPNNYNFYYSYAVVMQNPNHSQIDQPYFRIRLYDQNNQSIECAKYDVYAGNGDPAWTSKGSLDYVDWKSAFIPLQAYMGQTLSIEFTVGDCTQGGHACYAYIEGECDVPVKLSDTAACKGHPVLITAPAGAKSYLWSTGETTGSISVEKKGEYWVRMEGTAGGCFAYDTVHVGTYDLSTASFVMDTVCEGTPTHFTDNSFPANSISQWKWDFQNTGATNSTSQNATKTYPATGTYTAKLTVTNIHGCIDDTIRQIFVAPKPLAAFSSNPVCANDSTVFTNTSTGAITKYKWDFLNNNQVFSSLKNPKYKYSSTATAKLKVSTQYGCSDSITHPIVFNPLPVAGFTQTNVCYPAAMTFTNTSTVASGSVTQWKWNFGDGGTDNTKNPSHSYTSYGSDSVKVVVTSNLGCKDSITKMVTVYEKPTINFSATNVCDKISTTLTNSSSLSSNTTFASWNWDILNDGSNEYFTQNASHLFAAAGSYRILLKGTTNEGCWDTISKPVTIYPLPVALFSSNSVCKDDSTVFTNQSTGAISAYKWDFFNNNQNISSLQNPKYKYPSTGITTAKLRVQTQYGCGDSITHPVLFNPLPVANFTQTNVCYPSAMSFNSSSSSVSSGSVTQWNWNFGDNDTDNTQNPSHSYTAYGSKSVKLKVTSDLGCKDSITKTVTVYEKPAINFSTTNVCDKISTTLSNSSSLSSNATFASWNWDILNDGSNEYSTQNASHLFAAAGSYRILLKGTTNAGCWDTVSKPVTIYPLPHADFSSKFVCKGKATQYTDKSTGTITTWKWDFDNNNSIESSSQNPTYTFTNNGNFNSKLKIVSDKGCGDSTVKPTIVHPLPVAAYSASSVCHPLPVSFSNSSTVSPGNITYQKWTFTNEDDGSTAFNPTKSFSTHGTFNVKLFVRSDSGCVDSITKPVIYFEKPQVDFTLNDLCANTTLNLNNTSTVSSSTFSSWKWDVDNNSSTDYTTKNSSHRYTQHGLKTIQLIGATAQGCLDTAVKTMTVHPLPHADFSPIPNCVSDSAAFTESSSIPSGSITNYDWNFNEGPGAVVKGPKKKFSSEGNKQVRLIITSDKNCKDTISKPVIIYPLPKPNFTAPSVCLNTSSVFTNNSNISSVHSPNQISQHQWKFDDGQSSSNPQAQHLFATPGTHKVTLITTSAHNCVDSISKNIVVNPLPSPKFTSSTPAGCAQWCVDFTNATTVSSGTVTNYYWTFGDGNSSSVPNPRNCFDNPGSTPLSFDISLRATTDKGCVKDTVIHNMITAYPLTHADFSFTPGEITEDNNIVHFTSNSSGAESWLWKYDDGVTDNVENPEHKFLTVGEHTITLVVNNQYNCSDSTSRKIHEKPVWSYHIPNAFTPNGDGKNDKFYVYGYNIVDFKLYIFNRWGELIYTSTDITEGWDGIYNGEVVQIDTYVYKAFMTDIFGDKHSEVGIVNCIK